MMELIKAALEYGTAPAILILAALLALVAKRLTANEEKGAQRDERQRKRDEEIKAAFLASIKEHVEELKLSTSEQALAMEKRNQEYHREQQERLSTIAEKLSCVEKDYLPRDEHYKDFSGWRGEINDLRKEIHAFLLAISAPRRQADAAAKRKKKIDGQGRAGA